MLDYSYRIKGTTSSGCFDINGFEPTEADFFRKTDGEISAIGLDDEVTAGHFSLVYVELERAIDYFDLADLLDSDSESADYCPIIRRSGFSSFLARKLDLVGTCGDLLIIDKIALFPDFRGRGLGKIAIEKIIQCFGDKAAVVALIPVPLQFSGRREDVHWIRDMRFELFRRKQDKDVAQKHLVKFYESIGFTKIGKTDIMAKAIRREE